MSENNSSSRNVGYFLIPFFFLIGSYIGVITFAISLGKYTLVEYFIEHGDSFSALLTSISILLLFLQIEESRNDSLRTLNEIQQDRKLTMGLHQKETEIKRLTEQLDFYSELYDDFSDIYEIDPPNIDQKILQKRNDINQIFQANLVKKRYPRYVEKEDMITFSQYFTFIFKGLDIKNMNEKQKEETLKIINHLIIHVINEYDVLAEKYQEIISG